MGFQQREERRLMETPTVSRNSFTLRSFTNYCRLNPEERFWQALRNWSGNHFICALPMSGAANAPRGDTFHWEGRGELSDKGETIEGSNARAYRPDDLFSALCQCGAEIESTSKDGVCPKCGVTCRMEWPCVLNVRGNL